MNVQIAQNTMNDNEYKTCDRCCYDILDDEGNVMDHECVHYGTQWLINSKQNQAKVIRELWSELQSLKRILIDEHPDTWRKIKTKIQ